ncbi:4-phosphoerythronate dehydrogenase [Salisaeta longa]|uniref:4-phosphoerythronate dehydrogenase n=1 Tax=Salisaeta longa TaxID=503170 RepID=UPI0003B65284|nr:4-phosphoerythronate dehydrogenase [Salisaeta longa]
MAKNDLRIVADENIPAVTDAFSALGSVITRPGRAIQRADVADADVLLVRSVTRVTRPLLADTPVRFVGSATIGTDHIDRDFLEAAGVAFAHAPGSNADSVADYVLAALLTLATRRGVDLRTRTVGVVGYGNIGRRVTQRLEALGLRVLVNDPPLRANQATDRPLHPLTHLLETADVLTLHVPLTREGPHPTQHLIDAAALRRMCDEAWLLNTSRGAVVDNAALGHALAHNAVRAAVLDVWEDEPTPDPALVEAVDLATPHIAGYALDGKLRGTQMLYDAVCRHLDRTPDWSMDEALPPAPDPLVPPDPHLPPTEALHALAQQAYSVTADDQRLRPLVNQSPTKRGAFFSGLRREYPVRREMQCYRVDQRLLHPALQAAVTNGLLTGGLTDRDRSSDAQSR